MSAFMIDVPFSVSSFSIVFHHKQAINVFSFVISGEVLAMQFANLGAKLILSARNKDELERVKQNILSKYGNYF